MMRWPTIVRLRFWRRVFLLGVVIGVISIFLAVWSQARLSATGRSTPTREITNVLLRTVDAGVIVAHVDDGAPRDWPDDESVVVTYHGVVSSAMHDSLVTRRDLVYWSSHQVTLQDGRRVEPDSVEAVRLMTAADACFESTLPGGSASFLWNRGVKTWRESRTVADYTPLIDAVVLIAWLVTLGTAVAMCSLCGWREWLAHWRIRRRHCWRCGYDRSRSADLICPECGEENADYLRPRRPLRASRPRRSGRSSPPPP